MSELAFGSLAHPVRDMIVNNLGWTSLRQVQDESIPPILAGKNTVILAPTAGGKTEAAFFPLFSRMLDERWDGLSVLYVSPIRALLNNQQERLDRLTTLLGRSCGVWHGDVNQSRKKNMRKEPPNVLLTTPESLEGMLISVHTNSEHMFGNLQAIVIDEVHAFAGDDRGWHLLGVLERLAKWAGRDIQRIGLSATVGNKTEIVDWLSAKSPRARITIDPPTPPVSPEVTLDYVASLSNAARIIASLHRGEKRLVFCDSRIGAEKLTRELRKLEITTHIVHSSLSADERRLAERAFSESGQGVIVATSALELGIDIGDLDRVIQIDAPHSVASFLQRMGRTGRRAGMNPNILMLAITEEGLVRAGAILDLWQQGVVEAARAPANPYQILAQQMLATSLERPGMVVPDFRDVAARFAGIFGGSEEDVTEAFQFLMLQGFLFTDGVRMGMGGKGEEGYGKMNFLNLVSVFTTPPIFKILHGRKEIGEVDQSTFYSGSDAGEQVILLGGRSWRIESLSWKRRVAYVKPWDQVGKTKFFGAGPTMSRELAQAHREFLAGSDRGRTFWSVRAEEYIESIRDGFSWIPDTGTAIVELANDTELWTFAGGYANRYISTALFDSGYNATGDGLKVKVNKTAYRFFEDTLQEILNGELEPKLTRDHPMLKGLKFADLLPDRLLVESGKSRIYGQGLAELATIQPINNIKLN